MLNLIASAIVGVIVGILARYFYPGPVPMSMLMSMVLGIAGSLLAGFVTTRGTTGFRRAGLLASILGAMVLIFAARMLHIGT
ncbi:MAG: GlsB/YeaQ/YmgE family stress response membrane protein [Novosphingobium sp.]